MKKKILALFLLTLVLLSACQAEKEEGKKQISFYNWGEYIDPESIALFEEETGYEVIYTTYTTNEDLYVKLKHSGSSYDLIVPSDYMLERMIKEDMLEKIDWSKVPNLQGVDQDFLHQPFDPQQEYSAPYFWGTLGIVYNKEMVHEEVDSWSILWDEKYDNDIVMLDSSRDSIGLTLKYLGYSVNSSDPQELAEAGQLLIDQHPLIYAYLVDQIRDLMINDELALAVIFSGDAVDAMLNNDKLDYVIPKEGSNFWIDAMCIPKTARNKEGALELMNFLLRPDIMAMNAEYVGYSVPVPEAIDLLSEELRENPAAYPDDLDQYDLEVYQDVGERISLYDRLWQEVKNR